MKKLNFPFSHAIKLVLFFFILSICLIQCDGSQSDQVIKDSLNSHAAPGSIVLNGNGEPVLGEGYVGVVARCIPEQENAEQYVDVVIQEYGDPLTRTALIFLDRGENLKLVDPFDVSKTEQNNTRTYSALYFQITLNLEESAKVGERYPASTTFTVDGNPQTHNLLCGLIE